ncbi:MAG: hypothetical protein GYA86_09445 [Firmicutes bacterium]|nr:hypothetical protein [Bacillota bacterium]
MKKNRIYTLTPEEAWDEYVTYSVEMFVSFSYQEGLTNMADACSSYVKDIPKTFERPFPQSQLDHIANLLEKHIVEYVASIGGLSNLRVYTDEELEELWQEEVDELMLLLGTFIIQPEQDTN